MKNRVIQVADPLSPENFRNMLNEEVLEWGFVYFNNGWLRPEKELMPGLFTVVVNEPNPQEVSYRRSEAGLTDLFCTCGETKFRYCRHMAAVLFNEEKEI